MQIDQVPKLKSQIQKIGFYQVIGGITGIIFLLISFFVNGDFSGGNILVHTSMSLLFFYSIFCGILCLSSKENALRHSLINQFIQVVGFAILGFSFS